MSTFRGTPGDDIIEVPRGAKRVEAGDGNDVVVVPHLGRDKRLVVDTGSGYDRVIICDQIVRTTYGSNNTVMHFTRDGSQITVLHAENIDGSEVPDGPPPPPAPPRPDTKPPGRGRS